MPIKNKRTKKMFYILVITVVLVLFSILAIHIYNLTNNDESVKTDTTSSTQMKPDDTPVSKAEYLEVPEWGIKLKTSISDKILYIPRIIETYPEVFDMLGIQLNPKYLVDKNCVELGTDLYRQKTIPRFTYTKIGDYYYFVTGEPSQCSENKSDLELQSTVLKELTVSNISSL